MSLTTGQLSSLSFGYLSGANLLQYAASQLLISQFEKDNSLLQNGTTQAYSRIVSKLSMRYDVATELLKTAPIPAQGNTTITAGVITAIGVSFPGVNYVSTPVITISGGGGTGATATATVLNGIVTAISVTNGGSGYTSNPSIIFTGGLAPDTRSVELVKITAILAVQNVLGSLSNISSNMTSMFTTNKQDLKQIQDGQSSLPLAVPGNCQQSIPELVGDSFKTL